MSRYSDLSLEIRQQAVNDYQRGDKSAKEIGNGPMEGFWGILKTEMKHLFPYRTIDELIRSIEMYISYYNNERCQKKLKGLTPMEYRAQAS